MSTKQPLTEQWRSKLRESQQQLEDGSDRLRWVRRVYIRVYHFLMRKYGSRECDLHDCVESKATFVALSDNPTELAGKPPKSDADIRTALKSVKASNDRVDEGGPLRKGLGKLDWVALETYRNRSDVENCNQRLQGAKIECQIQRRGKDTIVFVRLRDVSEAREVAPRRTPETRENIQNRKRREHAVISLVFVFAYLMLCSYSLTTMIIPTLNASIFFLWMIVVTFIIAIWHMLQWLLKLFIPTR